MQDVHGRDGVLGDHDFRVSSMYVGRVVDVSVCAAQATDAPAIYPNYFSAEQDLIDTRNGFRETCRVFLQPAFDPYRGEQLKPSAEVNVDDDAELMLD